MKALLPERLPFEVKSQETITVAGLRGTGKTVLLNGIVEASKPDVAVWDPVPVRQADGTLTGQYDKRISYIPKDRGSTAELEAMARHLWTRAMRHGKGARLVIEEAEQVIPEGISREQFADLVQFAYVGRNLNLSFAVNSRRLAATSKHFTRQSDHLVLFKCHPGDYSYIKRELGVEVVGDLLRDMTKWPKDPRENGGGRFAHYHDGELHIHDRLKLRKT